MTGDGSFDNIMTRLRAGDDGTTREVFRRFAARLIGLARSQLDSRIIRKEDPEDVVQSVYRSFFRRAADGQFACDTWGDLWSLLTVITVRKCRDRADYFRA